MSFRPIAALPMIWLASAIGCHGGNAPAAIPTPEPGRPGIGAHGLSFFRVATNPTTISTPGMSTRASGSTMIVSVGRGKFSAFSLPTDNKGNAPYQRLGTEHTYTRYPNSGTGLYAFPQLVGGTDHVVRAATPSDDEITLAAVEVVEATTIKQFEWNEVLRGSPITSRAVTTTGPASLVAFWWGDQGVDGRKTATPNNGFVVVDSVGDPGELVQCFVAVKVVAAAGTYDVTWTSTPQQGAQLWLVAVQ